MNAQAVQSLGIGVLALGTVMLVLSVYGAYTFPSTGVPSSADLATILTVGWERLVLTISEALVGVVGLLTGTILYGFGRLIEEIAYLQRAEESGKSEKKSE